MKFPILLSNPHAGLNVPSEVKSYCLLTPNEVHADGDEGGREIFSIEDHVEDYITTSIARAIVDLNRSEEERWKDGVFKTHTCWDVPVYDPYPPKTVIQKLLKKYYRPYHQYLTKPKEKVRLGIDCHTMAPCAPSVAPDPGEERPWICLSNLEGKSCDSHWMQMLYDSFRETFDESVQVDHPFRGGYIIRKHHTAMPWVQLEMNRAPFLSWDEKRHRLLDALECFCKKAELI